ncbi:MAG: rhodanese-like domain-containing protein [Bacteroidales bacterium]|nr:rhodanese-like domain-containing protein [Bacteroidales bacterium]
MKILKNILLASVLLLMLSACNTNTKKEYKISAQETLDAYLLGEDILTVEKVANILLCKHEHHYQMIDLRTPPEFIKGHIDGAISIPAKNVLDMEYFDTFNQGEKINVLYCRGKNQAVNIYLILKQLGFKNIKVALGGYDYINDFIIEKYGINSGDYYGEKPKYDFIRLVSGIDQPKKDSISAPKVLHKNPNKVIKDFDEECPDLN